MRKFITMLILTTYIGLYIAAAATVGGMLVQQPKWLQLIYFVIAGVVWVFPLKPLMNWAKNGPAQSDDLH
jgi:membrane protein implicated in regulation of membrane protease activity